MFDIGFWELTLIAIVALLVVGPDRLPALARTVGLWVGKARRMVAQVKEDVERELRADEIRRMLDKPEEFDEVEKSLKDTQESLNETSRDLSRSAADDTESKASAPSAETQTPDQSAQEREAKGSRQARETPPAASQREGVQEAAPSGNRADERSHSAETGTPSQDASVTSSDDGDQTSRV